MALGALVEFDGPDQATRADIAGIAPMAAALREAVRSRATGWLVQGSPWGSIRLGFVEGYLVDGDASAPVGGLEQALMRYGLVGRGGLAALSRASLAAGRALYLGDLLVVALGRPQPAAMACDAGVPGVPDGPRLSTASVVLDSCRRLPGDEADVVGLLGGADTTPFLAEGADLGNVRLAPEEREFVSGAWGRRLGVSVAEDPGGVGVRALVALWCLGYAELGRRPGDAVAGPGPKPAWSPDGLVAIGRLYRDHGWRRRAAAMFRQALSLAPRHPDALSELGALPCSEVVGGRW